MRNIFDQYTQPENRLTHAILGSLDADRRLLKNFIQWAGVGPAPKRPLIVLEQALPGAVVDTFGTEEADRKGLPDGWIHDGQDWALLLEAKVSSSPEAKQIRRHLGMAVRRGFPKAKLLWLTVMPVEHRFGERVVSRTWADLYEWLVHQGQRSEWARRASGYLEVAEVQADMKEQIKTGALTKFSGIPFDSENPYSYVQAKRILGLLRNRLSTRADLARELDVDPNHRGRGAIKGRMETSVWDFVALKDLQGSRNFTQHLHLTIGVSSAELQASITVPNNVRSRIRTQILGETYEDFCSLILDCTERLEKALKCAPGAVPFFVLVQRRYASMSATPVVDTRLSFDPRTAAVSNRRKGWPKYQPEWLRAAYEALKHRRSNLQFQIGARFEYSKCSTVASAGIEDAVARTWTACQPLVKAGRERVKNSRRTFAL